MKHPSGRRFTKSDPLKRVVVEWGNDLELQIRRGTFIDPNAGKMRLVEWWPKWNAARTVAAATRSHEETHWRLYVQPAFGSWPMSSIQQYDVRAWVTSMVERKVKPTARVRALLLLRNLLEGAVEAKKIGENPALGVRAPKPPKHVHRFLDYDERDRLLEAITVPGPSAEGAAGERVPDMGNRLFAKLMLDAGLRWQEAAGLHRFRIDLKRRTVYVQEVIQRDVDAVKAQPKSEAGSRTVPLTDELVADLRAYLRAHPGDGLLFTTSTGAPLDYHNWRRRVFAPAVKRAELADPAPTPHDCRHSYGSWLADAGVPPHQIRDLMGHSSLRATEIYTHASRARMQAARDALAQRAREFLAEDGDASGRAPVVRPGG